MRFTHYSVYGTPNNSTIIVNYVATFSYIGTIEHYYNSIYIRNPAATHIIIQHVNKSQHNLEIKKYPLPSLMKWHH